MGFSIKSLIKKINPIDIVKKIAPTLGMALGGPIGNIAMKFIGKTLLNNPDPTKRQIEKAILNASPEDLIKLKNSDQDFEIKMKELGIRSFEIEVSDKQGARSLFDKNIWPQIILSALFIAGYFSVLFFLLSGQVKIPSGAMEGMVLTIIGVLTASIPQILGFWFGSSLGSKQKTSLLNGGK